MKIFTRKSAFFLASFVLFGLIFSGCSSNDEAKNVREYNNKIVALQQEMLENGAQGAGTIDGRTLDLQNALSEFQKIQMGVQQDYDKFKALTVPKGGEELGASMKRFFEVESNGIQNIIAVLNSLQGKGDDPKALDELAKALDTYSRNENDALANFDQVQKATAAKYKETVETTQKNSLS